MESISSVVCVSCTPIPPGVAASRLAWTIRIKDFLFSPLPSKLLLIIIYNGEKMTTTGLNKPHTQNRGLCIEVGTVNGYRAVGRGD